MKNSSSESVAGAIKGRSSERCLGSVIERLNPGLGIVDRLLEQSPPPQVSCRRSGFEEEPRATREELDILVEALSTADDCLLATVNHGPMPHTHSLVLWAVVSHNSSRQ